MSGSLAARIAQSSRMFAPVLSSLALLMMLAGAVSAQTVIRVANGLTNPIFATFAPGDSSRLFIVEQGSSGKADIKILNLADNTINSTPFLEIGGSDITVGGEQGLLGMAFDPNYATNGRFYVDYTAPGGSFGNGVTHIARYQVSSNPNVANAASRVDVLTIDQPQTNHNGGWIGFSNRAGDSGNLYVAMGDGGNGNDQGDGHIEPGGNAQNTSSLLGKMLRINVSTPGPAEHPHYSIPSNNPFASGASGAPEVFLTGLRNPFRNSFDTQTGNLFIGDVGQGAREEIDVQKASNPGGGENYGWRLREGKIATPGVGGTAPSGAIDPILDYTHSTTGRTVIGGYVYRGGDIPGLEGKYVFGDYLGPGNSTTNPNNQGRIFTLNYNGTTASGFTDITQPLFLGTGFTLDNPYSFGADARNELYIVDGSGGSLYKIVAATVLGDANHDGVVNSQDVALVGSSWLLTGANRPADVTHDGVVNAQDIAAIGSHWLQRQGSGATAVSEPTSMALLLCAGGLLGLARYRRMV